MWHCYPVSLKEQRWERTCEAEWQASTLGVLDGSPNTVFLTAGWGPQAGHGISLVDLKLWVSLRKIHSNCILPALIKVTLIVATEDALACSSSSTWS